ncbi:AN1-type zinc finger protein 1 isoform X1 [Pocillopora verrucosa]|uniref:AN1-type zinc finger protein 1 isoform X1 n=1 Tax=Pocillopora verrucosa TaxID=203993 RepID=UPI002797AADA|nr:AN1-type zinc finger protein 1-like isoform X1 [Pocillopora verrucosa]
MAEFPDFGKQCDVEICKQLDFLPFICNGCSGTFCLEHRSKSSHNCTVDDQKFKGDPSKTSVSNGFLECSLNECNSRELVPVLCEHCHKNYCLRHRHQVDHQCPGLPQKQPRVTPEQRIQQIIGKDLCKEKKGRGGVRNESRAAKVALMKMKMKATGDGSIPQVCQEERIYLRVLMPLGNKEREYPMYFSKYWTVGKVIDKIAVTARLKNDNNKAVAKKLRLFHGSSGDVLDLQNPLEHFQTQDDCPVLSGSTVVLECVDEQCAQLLTNRDKYPT